MRVGLNSMAFATELFCYSAATLVLSSHLFDVECIPVCLYMFVSMWRRGWGYGLEQAVVYSLYISLCLFDASREGL